MDVPDRQTASPPPILPYASPAPPQGASSVLTPEQLAQLAAARKLGAGLRRAAIVGRVDAWTTGIFGMITLVGSIGSIHGILLGAGMAVVAVFQLKAADRLRELDETAPLVLARNQIILGILLFLYGAISMVLVMQNPAPLSSSASAMGPELAEMLAPYEALARTLYLAVYSGVMVTAIVGPGLTALYYYAQRKRIITYRTSTPGWILALQHAGVVI